MASPRVERAIIFSMKVSWAVPEYQKSYGEFISYWKSQIDAGFTKTKDEILAIQEKLETLSNPTETNDTDVVNTTKALINFADLREKAIKFLKLLKPSVESSSSTESSFSKEPILDFTKINDPKKILEGLIKRYYHNLADMIHDIWASVETIIEVAKRKQIVYSNKIESLVKKVEEASSQFSKFFDILANGASAELQAETINLPEYLSALQQRYRDQTSAAKIKLNFNVEYLLPEPYTLFSDPKLIDQVLNNLVKNAIEHLSEHPEPMPQEINMNICLRKNNHGYPLIHVIVSNPSSLSTEQISQIAQLRSGYSHKDGFKGESEEHGIGLSSSSLLCETTLGGNLSVYEDRKNRQFAVGVEFRNLS